MAANQKYLTKSDVPWVKGNNADGAGAQLGSALSTGKLAVAFGNDEDMGILSSGIGSLAHGNVTAGSIEATGNGCGAVGDSDGGVIRASGYGTLAYGCSAGDNSLIEGSSYGAFAFGSVTCDDASTAEIKATEEGSHAEGCAYAEEGITHGNIGIYATGVGSHAEGYAELASIRATGTGSHAEGHADGNYGDESGITASGDGSHAEGVNTIAQNYAEHAQGKFNKSNKKTNGTAAQNAAGSTIHSVGIGTSISNRVNAFEIMQNGDVYVYGVGGYDGTNAGIKTSSALRNLLSYTRNDDIGIGISELARNEYDKAVWSLFVETPDAAVAMFCPALLTSNMFLEAVNNIIEDELGNDYYIVEWAGIAPGWISVDKNGVFFSGDYLFFFQMNGHFYAGIAEI